jgi:hypothetical protein
MELFKYLVAEFCKNPEWALLLMLLIPVAAAFSCWRAHRRQVKQEAMPHTMDERQYARFNQERFNGK